MTSAFSILGRGQAGRALASAWGPACTLLPHDARPDGWVLLAVPDRAIAELAGHFPGRCVHLSGSLHLPGVPSAHPLTSFDGQARDWSGTPLAVTGDVPALLLEAFRGLGFLPFPLAPDQKALYHACAVLTSGHAATLWLGAGHLLEQAGIRLPGRGLMPLAESTVRNIADRGAEGLTGPFVRGDGATIARDAEALPGPWRDVFLSLGPLGREEIPPARSQAGSGKGEPR
ncbi:MAG TPA: DUF2520 domain-containing protein [Holophaga sp.]|nr:DUF2520 domain-containing protein [Holophaga sp.]